MKKVLTCKEVSIPYSAFVDMRKADKLNLGIDNSLALEISQKFAGSKKIPVSAAFHFWNWVAFAVLGYFIYLSFKSHRWWFFVGFFLMRVIWDCNKRANTTNVLDAAFSDEDFYEQVRAFGGWLYGIDETEIDKLAVPKNN